MKEQMDLKPVSCYSGQIQIKRILLVLVICLLVIARHLFVPIEDQAAQVSLLAMEHCKRE